MSDLFQTLSISEGMPMEAPPSAILKACRLRRIRRRQDMIGLAVATSGLILSGFSEKRTDPMDCLKHLYTDEELERYYSMRAEAEQMQAQMAQIEKLRRLCG